MMLRVSGRPREFHAEVCRLYNAHFTSVCTKSSPT